MLILMLMCVQGEYHQLLPSGSRPWSVEERVHNCVEALLSEMDFFRKENVGWLPRIAPMLDVLKVGTAGCAVQWLEHEMGLV